MSMGQLLASGCAAVFNPGMFLMVCVAIILGTIFGALPGVSATMAVALGLTFTYTMEPIPAIVFLVAIYCSSITGGSITAILFKIPGVPSSAPTTFDGYPMAQRGEAGKALGVALLSVLLSRMLTRKISTLLTGIRKVREGAYSHRAAVRGSDEIAQIMQESLARRTYTMSLMAMVFLPSTFLTGLFGVNLGGIPGNSWHLGFSLFCLMLVVVIGGVAWWLHRSNWL